jgi:phosphoadenosine phosphosulfate reductase
MFDTDKTPATGHDSGLHHPVDISAEEDHARALAARYGGLDAEGLLDAVINREFAGRVALVSSFGVESAVLLDLVARVDPDTPVIFIDTGKLFPETLAYCDRLVEFCGLGNVRTIAPDADLVAARDSDGTLWSRDPDACCALRKVLPLGAALVGFDAWISGRKRFHGGGREALETIESDGQRIKISPLAHWTQDDIERYLTLHDLPRHPLAAEGFASLGCQPCTRRVAAGETVRAGRWAGADKTECGIHLSGLSLVCAGGRRSERKNGDR